jgi:hypothetical protein
MKKEFQERYDNLNSQMLEIIKQNKIMLETGLREMRERYNEDKIRRIKKGDN